MGVPSTPQIIIFSSHVDTTKFRMANGDDDKEVNVNLIDDVDAFTLTAVGFGLIAFNFLVLANVSAVLQLFCVCSSFEYIPVHPDIHVALQLAPQN